MTSPSREAFDAAHCRNPADCQSCDGTGSGGFGIGCTDCLGTGREPCRAGCAYPLCNCDATAAAAIGGPRYEREAFAKYIAECDELAIVPDAAGAFNWAWQAAIQHARDVATAKCAEISEREHRDFKGLNPDAPPGKRGNSYVEGLSDGADLAGDAIKEALK